VLILTRKVGESIMVGDNIRVVVLEVRGRQIRLGIDAPTDIVVLREEISQRLTHENLRAANFNLPEVEEALHSSAPAAVKGLEPSPSLPETESVLIKSAIVGELQVAADQIITFNGGLPGFPDSQRYVLVKTCLGAPFSILQSVDNPEVAFVVVDPAFFVPEYRPKNGVNVLKDLQAVSFEDLQILVTMTIPPGRPGEMTANLMSPLMVNPALGLGKQVVIDKPLYSYQHPIMLTDLPGRPRREINGKAAND